MQTRYNPKYLTKKQEGGDKSIMGKLLFFDVMTHKNGHYWFYNYNVLCAVLQKGRQVGYCSLFESLDMAGVLKKEGICVYECERLFSNLIRVKNRLGNRERFYKIKKNLKEHMTLFPSQMAESIRRYFVFYKKRNFYRELLIYTDNIIKKEGYNNLHIFELDVMLFNYFINIFKQFDVPLTATLHWFPVNPQSKKTLYRLITDGILKKIIVHGDFIRKSVLELVGDRFANVVQSIEYPSNGNKDISVEEAKKIVGWGKKCINQPVFLCFGTMRYDKGLDILLKALSGVEGSYSLVIAGKEGNYGYNYIKKRIRKYNIKGDIILDLKYIPNKNKPTPKTNHCFLFIILINL